MRACRGDLSLGKSFINIKLNFKLEKNRQPSAGAQAPRQWRTFDPFVSLQKDERNILLKDKIYYHKNILHSRRR
jgi:hypothetical protein